MSATKTQKKKNQKSNVAFIAEMPGSVEDGIKLDLFPGEKDNLSRGTFPGFGGGRQNPVESNKRYDEDDMHDAEDSEAANIVKCLESGSIPIRQYAGVGIMCFIGWIISAVSLNFESCLMTPFAGAHTNILLASQILSWIWVMLMGVMERLGVDTLVPLSSRFCVASFLASLALLGATLSIGKINGNGVAICMDEDNNGAGCTKFVSCEFCDCFADGGECVIVSEAGEVQFDGVVHDLGACQTYQAGVFFGAINAGLMSVVAIMAFRMWTKEASKPPTEIVRQLVSLTQQEISNMKGRTYSAVSGDDEGLQNTDPDDDTML